MADTGEVRVPIGHTGSWWTWCRQCQAGRDLEPMLGPLGWLICCIVIKCLYHKSLTVISNRCIEELLHGILKALETMGAYNSLHACSPSVRSGRKDMIATRGKWAGAITVSSVSRCVAYKNCLGTSTKASLSFSLRSCRGTWRGDTGNKSGYTSTSKFTS